MASSKFITEGEAYIKDAEKSTKTTLLKWNADFDLAASSYTKAATAFKNAKDAVRSMDCSVKAGECHLKNKVPFQAAKSFEQAAFSARDAGDLKKIPDLINRAYLLYMENGTPDTAGTLLDRGARMLEEQLPEQAVLLYQKAANLAQINDKPEQASELLDRAGRLLVKMEKYDEAAKVLEELIENELKSATPAGRRYVLCLVLVQLKREDYVRAKRVYESGSDLPNHAGSGELGLAKNLLDAYDRYDSEAFKALTSSAFIRSLDPAYARLARSLEIPEGDCPEFSSTAKPAAAQSNRDQESPTGPAHSAGTHAADQDDDDLT